MTLTLPRRAVVDPDELPVAVALHPAQSELGVPSAEAPSDPEREWLRKLNWGLFETLVETAFTRDGFAVLPVPQRLTGRADMLLQRREEQYLVQCKHWKAWQVGTPAVAELHDLVTEQNMGNGLLITAGKFSPEAAALAEESGLLLLDGDDLLRMAAGSPVLPLADETTSQWALPKGWSAFGAPTCPLCEKPMLYKRVRAGEHAGMRFWGCANYPTCRAIREVGPAYVGLPLERPAPEPGETPAAPVDHAPTELSASAPVMDAEPASTSPNGVSALPVAPVVAAAAPLPVITPVVDAPAPVSAVVAAAMPPGATPPVSAAPPVLTTAPVAADAAVVADAPLLPAQPAWSGELVNAPIAAAPAAEQAAAPVMSPLPVVPPAPVLADPAPVAQPAPVLVEPPAPVAQPAPVWAEPPVPVSAEPPAPGLVSAAPVPVVAAPQLEAPALVAPAPAVVEPLAEPAPAEPGQSAWRLPVPDDVEDASPLPLDPPDQFEPDQFEPVPSGAAFKQLSPLRPPEDGDAYTVMVVQPKWRDPRDEEDDVPGFVPEEHSPYEWPTSADLIDEDRAPIAWPESAPEPLVEVVPVEQAPAPDRRRKFMVIGAVLAIAAALTVGIAVLIPAVMSAMKLILH